MDLPSKNMYDAFKDHIWKELGPLDPDWFQVLTAQTFTGEGSVSDPDDLCANQEGHFKTPLDKAALDSQLFSTPKVFRHRRVVSPETTEGEQSFTPEQEKETLPWTETQSPQLFRVTKESVPGAKYGGMRHQNLEHFDMVHTPSKSPVSYAKQISESLGAQIHPDISWTSSLNTPPAVPSTLILSKTDESPCPMSVSEDKTVVIVRKLFPSLSNGAGVAATSPTNTGLPLPRGVISPEADQIPESHGSPQESLNPTASVWRQKLPDAIEGGDVRSTVASVLDGAENVLSIFFSNSSSALRKVKTDRVKRKQIIATKEHGCSFTDILTANNAAVAPSEQRTEELEPVELSSPPQLKTRDIGITQWSPLSLSEIPPFTDSACCEKSHATQVENNILTERPQSDSVSGQLVRLPLTGTFSGFTKRKRKFVYTIDTSRIQGKETASLKTDSSSQIPDSGYKVSADLLRKAPDEAACPSIRENEKQKQKNVTEENLPLSVQPNVQDLDMSQLCRDFAHDFTQTSDPGKLSEVAKDNPRNGFSPSACLSAMKQAKQKAKQASVLPDCDGVSVRRPVSATNQNDSINEGTVSDSGFQSAVADITHPTSTSFILPSSENIGQSQQWSTTGTYRAASSLSTNTRNRGKNNLDEMLQEAETDAKLPGAIKESRTLVPCRKNEHTESTSTQLPGGAKGSVTSGICFPSECQVNDSFPEKTTVSLPSVHASGFKTASNKTIKISSVDLEKAKHLFEENEAERTFSDQPSKRAHDTKDEISMSDVSGKNTIPNQPPSSREHFGDISCQLTVSQKADVTELCTLLEEADSQFEFTQFKTAKLQQHCQDNATSPRKVDKELDPDFLMGIDFDDSFDDRRSDAEKHLVTAVMLDKMTLVADHKTNCETSKVTSKSSMKKENASIEDALSSSKCISEGSHGIMSAEPQNLDRARCTETSKQENKSPLMLGGGFKTARGNFLTVSKECLSKARALFADLEDNLTEQKSAGEQSGDAAAETDQRQVVCIKDNNAAKSFKNDKIDTTTCQSGRGISISAKAMKEADALFKDCDISENNTGGHKKNLLNCKNIQETEENFSAEGISEFKKGNAGPAACHTEVVQHIVEMQSAGLEDTKALTNAVSSRGNLCSTAKTLSSPSGTASKNSGSSAVNQLSNGGGGFCTATSGKGVVISAAALKKAKSLLSECEAIEDKKPVCGLPSRNSGFLAASGKPVALSAAALQKAKALFSDITVNAEIPAASDTRKSDSRRNNSGNSDKIPCGFMTAGGTTVCVSQNNLFKATNALREFDGGSLSEKTKQGANTFFKDCDTENGVAPVSGGSSEHGRGCSEFENSNVGSVVNEENLMRHDNAEILKGVFKNSNSTSGNPSFMAKPLSSPLCTTSKNTGSSAFSGFSNGVGFCSASGKRVSVSDEAMTKAKSLLNETPEKAKTLPSKGVEDKISVESSLAKMPVSFSPPRICGFLAASGKPMAFSSEALQKAKALFNDIGFSEVPIVSDKRKSDKHEDVKNINCGFTTAGGAKVQVSQKNLMNAKNLLKDFADGESPSESDLSNEAVNVLGPGVNHTSSGEALRFKSTEESSFLMFQSLNLSGCSETQQRFFAQEALDCTKALLEDESLAGQSPTVEKGPLQDTTRSNDWSAEEQKGRGKRSVDDADMTGQPPLKRRLLDEFDRTVDGPRGSTLHPQKSSPNSVMKDRRAFKYSVSPHPNITRPYGSGTNYVETKLQNTTPTQRSASGDGRSAHCRVPAFVPPFLKNTKTETHKNAVVKVSIKTPSAFVPPFKKQRTVVQESSCKPQEEEDKHQHVCIKPTSSNIYMSPSRNTQNSADATSDKSKEYIQAVALAHTTNDNLMNNQKAPGGCGSEDSAAMASCDEDTVHRGQDMFSNLENVEMARDMQDMRIRKKKRQTIRPLPGSLFLTKTSGVQRIPLKAAVDGKPPARFTPKQLYGYGVHQHVFDITSETSETFRFNLKHFLKLEAFIDGGGVHLADGGWLIPSNDGTAGREEFYRALCDTPGVDPKLISVEWAYNHYRWIVWKQASMERSFPETMSSLCLTPEQLLLQLKYRYDVEIDHSRRPALRKIMEKDDTAAKTLVLCVCGVVSRGHSPNRPSRNDTKTPQGANAKVEPPFAVVWLTDGWYAIKALLDEALTAMLHKGRLAVGGKLIMCGAQLVGSQEACSPLEAPESLMLKICANSSRLARWDAKLGFHRDPRPFLLPVSCLYSNGGPVGCVDITILRSYPIQWMERKPDGGVVFRSVRAEEKEARRYSSHQQKAMEILFAKIQTEFEKEQKGNDKPQRRRRTTNRQDIASLQDGEELYDAVGDDPAYLEAQLSEQQSETLQTYRRSLMEKKQSELQDRYRRALEAENSDGSCPKREVTPVWRLCIADSTAQPGSVYQLNLWRPPSDLQSLLKEGCRYKVYNLTTSDGKKRNGVENVQLTGTKKTQFQDLQASQEWLLARFQPRASSNFVNLQNPEFRPLCGEVDLTGYIISVIDGLGSSPAFYLADGELNFVKVRCFSSFAQSGLEDVVKLRVLLALSNLQLRGQSSSPTPVVFAGDLTIFSTNPKEVHLQESLSQLRNLLQVQQNFFLNAEEKLSHLLKSDGLSSITSPALHPRTPAATNQRQDTKTSLISQQPIRSLGSFTPVSRNQPAVTASTEKDPKSLKRRRALDYLSRIPSPPTLSHLGPGTSLCVKKTFNPPRRSGTPSTLKTVQTPARKTVVSPMEDEWVNDEELAMIDTQTLRVG
ncbi:putative breast cancer type 2 susceptibility protein -like [Scophthalmus maximus]|uniref:Putative breast cancer type 2 susceptibility protein-like n=1 Tax=Scophthalmus maximus TaxID=52904 RepID=A0A2U9B4U4_SCOMX|nr:putative breast cancer type 2 susceptibility protein -like [Scophthalmus maximus]